MKRGGAVYTMTNRRNGTLYTGVTADLKRRVWEHREGRNCEERSNPEGFTSRYGCKCLVYWRGFDRIEEAIAEEKRIKGGSRAAKLHLIEEMNPQWNDLWTEIENW